MRISDRARRLVGQAQFDEALLLLLELDHVSWTEPLRYACSELDVTSNGIVYSAKGFSIPLPAQSKTDLAEVALQISDVDRSCARALRSITERKPGTASLIVILSGAPDVVEVGPMTFQFTEPTISNRVCTFKLGLSASLNETFPFHRYRPATHPGLFDNEV